MMSRRTLTLWYDRTVIYSAGKLHRPTILLVSHSKALRGRFFALKPTQVSGQQAVWGSAPHNNQSSQVVVVGLRDSVLRKSGPSDISSRHP